MFKLAVCLALVTLVLSSECPNNAGECCEDNLHCCPEGMLCNVKNLTCINGTHTQMSVKRIQDKQPKLPKSFRMISSLPASESSIPCPDGSFCPAEFSCLLMSSSYGCCPVAQGRVCSDVKHCCPKDHECSTDSSLCVKRKLQVLTVLCGNGTSECPSDTTCCQTKDKQWGCCPMPKGVCCEDKIHCCPENSVCDVKGSKCISPTNQEFPMWAKFPARLRAKWEDHKPIEKSNATGLKTIGKTTTVGIKKTTVTAKYPRVSSSNSTVPCNDTVYCPDKNTCCKTKDGGWACCPLPEAVCCEDSVHCCPHGKTCDVANGTCEDASGSVPWLKKLPAQLIHKKKVSVTQGGFLPSLEEMTTEAGADQTSSGRVSCNSSHVCPESSTCCNTVDGDWGCCPFSKAVCCTDGEHCCPSLYMCDMSSFSCIKEDVVIPWYNKMPAESTPAPGLDVVQCDEESNCSSDSTCCLLSTEDWGCCPLPAAVCCPDQKHCCPEGYGCDLHRHSCVKITQLFVEVIQLTHIQGKKPKSSILVKDVPCGGGYSCKDGETCCPTSQTTWGCCPSSKAECCADMKHCCPEGYRCGVGGTCTSTKDLEWSNWLNWKLFFSREKRAITL
ncbi:hypothetical protein DNTS_015711 [Danionella cerebrum]|uniref:Granulins domain-containing protein n=1 Tax=Danionella cerebrum TaxID=2873325 RepID=A0A553QD14_9TELE|nr:hypothetical protein DNTS_015711 [Danionella translucida]